MNPKASTDPAAADGGYLHDSAARWVARHVPRFRSALPRYEECGIQLQRILAMVCRILAPDSLVTWRVKAMSGFAEKILRKQDRYSVALDGLPGDPMFRVTDLCGARVIVQTREQVEAVCGFIRRSFDIDWANSEDVSARLKPQEFGYRSVHLIVSFRRGVFPNPDVPVTLPDSVYHPVWLDGEPEPIPLKAEIQVRTLLEHAWADIGHDLTYKPEWRVPDGIRREFAALAATLESTDGGFSRLVSRLEEYRSNYGAYHPRAEVEREIHLLRLVAEQEPEDVKLAVRLAHMALSIGWHETALQVLERHAAREHPGVLRGLGLATCELHMARPSSDGYLQGRDYLERACTLPGVDAETMTALAECLWPRQPERARALLQEAAIKDPGEPVTTSRYLEYELSHGQNPAMVGLCEPMIRNAMRRCRQAIAAKVNVPAAWTSLALFHLLVREDFEALDALAQLIRHCQPGQPDPAMDAGQSETRCRPCAAGAGLLRLREAVRRLECIRESLPGFSSFERLLSLGMAVRLKEREAGEALSRAASQVEGGLPYRMDAPVVILAGGCSPTVADAVRRFGERLLEGCRGLSMDVVSGGTLAGICRVAGDLAAASGGRIRAFGYLPASLPRGEFEDLDSSRYQRSFATPQGDFGPEQVLQAWTDLVAAGVEPCRVKVLAFAGRRITRVEIAVALALGGQAGVVDDPLLPADRRFKGTAWDDHPGCIPLPLDAMTLRAFLLIDRRPVDGAQEERLEKAAQIAHEDYLKSATPRDPSHQRWKELDADLKLSNFHQVAYWEVMLEEEGLGLRRIQSAGLPAPPPSRMAELIGEEGIARLAEKEHGRWNVERLSRGWRYAKEKDVGKRRSPYLVPWNELSEEIQGYDLAAMRSLPQKLWAAGLEVYRLSEHQPGGG